MARQQFSIASQWSAPMAKSKRPGDEIKVQVTDGNDIFKLLLDFEKWYPSYLYG